MMQKGEVCSIYRGWSGGNGAKRGYPHETRRAFPRRESTAVLSRRLPYAPCLHREIGGVEVRYPTLGTASPMKMDVPARAPHATGDIARVPGDRWRRPCT